MWRNRDVEHFLDWLRDHNDSLGSDGEPVGFCGLDLYSLHASMRAVVDYLDRVDAAARARARYACFDQVGGDLIRRHTPSRTSRARTRSWRS